MKSTLNTDIHEELTSPFMMVVIWIITCALVVIVLTFSATVMIDDIEPKHHLTIDQQQIIVYDIGIEGYKNLLKDGCSSIIAEKIATGKWQDLWCAEHYVNLTVVN